MKILGMYDSAGKAAAAASAIRQAQQGDVVAYSPTAEPRLVEPRTVRSSPIRLFTLLGGLVGGAIGIALPVYTMLDWSLVVGGQPILSIPPIVVIAFELSMLCAALGGFLGFLVLGGIAYGRNRGVRRAVYGRSVRDRGDLRRGRRGCRAGEPRTGGSRGGQGWLDAGLVFGELWSWSCWAACAWADASRFPT